MIVYDFMGRKFLQTVPYFHTIYPFSILNHLNNLKRPNQIFEIYIYIFHELNRVSLFKLVQNLIILWMAKKILIAQKHF